MDTDSIRARARDVPHRQQVPDPAEEVLGRSAPANYQFTIGRTMKLIAVFAIFLAMTPTGLAAVIMFSTTALYYALYRYGLSGPWLPALRPPAKDHFWDELD